MKGLFRFYLLLGTWGGMVSIVLSLVTFLHYPYWVAILLGYPVGLILGLMLGQALFNLTSWVLKKQTGDVGVSILEDTILPVLVFSSLTLIIIPVFSQAKHRAQQMEHLKQLKQHSSKQTPQ